MLRFSRIQNVTPKAFYKYISNNCMCKASTHNNDVDTSSHFSIEIKLPICFCKHIQYFLYIVRIVSAMNVNTNIDTRQCFCSRFFLGKNFRLLSRQETLAFEL